VIHYTVNHLFIAQALLPYNKLGHSLVLAAALTTACHTPAANAHSWTKNAAMINNKNTHKLG